MSPAGAPPRLRRARPWRRAAPRRRSRSARRRRRAGPAARPGRPPAPARRRSRRARRGPTAARARSSRRVVAEARPLERRARVVALVLLHLLVHPLDDLRRRVLADQAVEERRERLDLGAEADRPLGPDDVGPARVEARRLANRRLVVARVAAVEDHHAVLAVRIGGRARGELAFLARDSRLAGLLERPLDQLAAELVLVRALGVQPQVAGVGEVDLDPAALVAPQEARPRPAAALLGQDLAEHLVVLGLELDVAVLVEQLDLPEVGVEVRAGAVAAVAGVV